MRLFVSDSYNCLVDHMCRVFSDWGQDIQKAERATRLRPASLSIINECATDCGENIGGSSTATAAPEVAASDDDGDGDGDPDPDRRRTGRPTNTRNTLPSTVEHFDRLPDSACIDIAALKAITGKSRATLYRWIDKGILPKPRKLGLTSNNVWAAGDIRRALSA
ncbi:helix-turn-helix transcriptional regulator [Cognatazoarcus halotolerans]|uniref:helix-turn-helix transcriptional regulator n=1 Tax=Cognatazoarcus halotolerans TaxID=2686016 RepID=UPI00135A425C|nr:AlpA family phage regulatory protein [Cognatazoarcus halotolerans]MCB1899847.1 AlpA family phage regulatory protein [Rhodocyclaceae bacterium]MCP5309345.1 AlpA family phage regulatory protein [Zoogloeaceae bacterium]